MAASFKGVARTLGTAISERPDLRITVCQALRTLITKGCEAGTLGTKVGTREKTKVPGPIHWSLVAHCHADLQKLASAAHPAALLLPEPGHEEVTSDGFSCTPEFSVLMAAGDLCSKYQAPGQEPRATQTTVAPCSVGLRLSEPKKPPDLWVPSPAIGSPKRSPSD